jgi:uncharacterized protein (DUF1697 family)
MARLRALFQEMGFGDVATFIASGNVVFSAPRGEAARLEVRIASHLKKSLGYEVDTFVRTLDAVKAIARAPIFPEEGRPGITVHVGFLQNPLPPEIARALGAVKTPTDEIRVEGSEYHWLCRIRVPDSKVWSLPEIRALRIPTSTMRNITSVRKLVAQFGLK